VPKAGEGSLVVKISPLDVRRQVFRKTMRGCDPEEVRTFLEMVANELENAMQERAMLSERCQMQEQRLDEYRQLEQSMRNSLVTADRIATESRDASERESQRVIQDAHARAERILGDARERLQGLVQEIEALRAKREVFVNRFRALLESQNAILDEHAGDRTDMEVLERGAARLGGRIENDRARLADAARAQESLQGGQHGPAIGHAPNPQHAPIPQHMQAGQHAQTGQHAQANQAAGPARDFAGNRDFSGATPSGASAANVGNAPMPQRSEIRYDEELGDGAETSRPRFPVRRSEAVGEAAPAPNRPQPEPTAEGIARGVGRFFRRNDAVVPLRSGRQPDPNSPAGRSPETPQLNARRGADGSESSLFPDNRAARPNEEFGRMRERSEGIFEISASDETNRDDRGRSA